MPCMFTDDHLLCILVDGLETFTQRKYNRYPSDAVCGGPMSCACSAAVLWCHFISTDKIYMVMSFWRKLHFG